MRARGAESPARRKRQAAGSGTRLGAALATACLVPCVPGWAAHPFLTDDAGTQGAGRWQLELMTQRDRHDALIAGPTQVRERSTLVNPVLTYGWHDTLDVALGASHLRTRVSENGAPVERAQGAGDATLELKWRFLERDGASLALKPGLVLPTGDEARGLGTGRVHGGATLIGALEAGRWAFFGNVAYTRVRYRLAQDAAENRRDLWRVSAGATWALGPQVKLAGEAGVRTNEPRGDPTRPGQRAAFAMVGLIWSPAETVDLDVGLRRGLDSAETDTVLLAGATLRW